jgi:hypothetical protein
MENFFFSHFSNCVEDMASVGAELLRLAAYFAEAAFWLPGGYPISSMPY